jgi:hypothetical protein
VTIIPFGFGFVFDVPFVPQGVPSIASRPFSWTAHLFFSRHRLHQDIAVAD